MIEKLKNIELIEQFKKMSESQLSDFKYLSDFIYNKVGLNLHVKNCEIKNHTEMTCWGGMGSKQYPDELAKFLVFIYDHKKEINSYCEIGPFQGGTFYTVDSFLRAINPDMGKSLAVDIRKTILQNGFDVYKKENLEVDFLHIDSLDFVPDQKYDLCLIDGNHAYDYVKHDYKNMIKYVKFLAIHDIKITKRPYDNVRKFWESLKNVKKIELLNEDERFVMPVGIGVIINE